MKIVCVFYEYSADNDELHHPADAWKYAICLNLLAFSPPVDVFVNIQIRIKFVSCVEYRFFIYILHIDPILMNRKTHQKSISKAAHC